MMNFTTINSTNVFPYSPDHKSDWIFPPPVNQAVLFEWLRYARNMSDRTDEPNATLEKARYFEVEATRNRTTSETQDEESATVFGSEATVLHVGDVIEAECRPRYGWVESITMNCVVCSSGPPLSRSSTSTSSTSDDSDDDDSDDDNGYPDEDPDAAQDASRRIFSACANYTDTSRRSTFGPYASSDIVGSTHYIQIPVPSDSNALVLPDEAVGVCSLMLLGERQGQSNDLSVAFPIALNRRKEMAFRFQAGWPRGYPDITIKIPGDETRSEKEETRGGGLSGGAVVGIVIGVLLGVLLCGVLGCFAWRNEKTRARKNGVDGRVVEENELRRLERGGVVRDVGTERDGDGEAPPAYHEVVRFKGDRDVRV